jgi:hypothetical protein
VLGLGKLPPRQPAAARDNYQARVQAFDGLPSRWHSFDFDPLWLGVGKCLCEADYGCACLRVVIDWMFGRE